MASASSLPELPVGVDMTNKDCPPNTFLYQCEDIFLGCCRVDPCPFVSFTDPCLEALANGSGDGSIPTDTASITSTAETADTTSGASSPTDDGNATTTSDNQPTSTADAGTDGPTDVPTDAATDSLTIPVTYTTDPTLDATMVSTISVPTSTSALPTHATNAPPFKYTKMVIGIVGGVGGVVCAIFVVWFIRRRMFSKRMSSDRGNSPVNGAEKRSIWDHPESLTGTALGTDVFEEFGGRAQSPVNTTPGIFSANTVGGNEGWPLSPVPPQDGPRPQQSQQFNATTQPNIPVGLPERQSQYFDGNTEPRSFGPRQSQSQQFNATQPNIPMGLQERQSQHFPANAESSHAIGPSNQQSQQGNAATRSHYIELDSVEVSRPGPDVTAGPATQRRPKVHPAPLTPGLPGAFQPGRARGTSFRDRYGHVQYQHNEHRDQHFRGLNPTYPTQNRHHENQRSSSDGRWDVPRATLGATEHELRNNCYANSWSTGP